MSETLPHPNRLRVLLTDKKIQPEELNRTGELYLQAGRPNVAIMLYERAQSNEGAAKVKALALKEGDEFLLSAVARMLPVEAAEWRACAEAAISRQKYVFARDAWRKAGDAEKAAEMQQKLFAIFTEPVPKPQA